VTPDVPPGVEERFRGRAGATKVEPGRFEAAAMTAARRFAAANCRAADHFCASLDASLNHDPLHASRRASTRVDRCVVGRHRFAASQVVASLAAASCLETVDRPDASLYCHPVGATLRVSRRATTEADRHGAGRHQIAFHCAKASHRAADFCFRYRVQIEHDLFPLTLLAPLTPGDAASARRRVPAVCNLACVKAVRSARLECLWALTDSDHRLV
jgi:hypothetical protein